MTIALNTVVYNEQHRIIGLLAHAGAFCDELVVVDQGSTDRTVELAVMMGATVISDTHHGFCEPSRPLAAERTLSEWILVLDADEVVHPSGIPLLVEIAAEGEFDAVALSVHSYTGGRRDRPDGYMGENRKVRFFRKGLVSYDTGLHTQIAVLPSARTTILPITAPILNTKEHWEWQMDHDRYQKLAAT